MTITKQQSSPAFIASSPLHRLASLAAQYASSLSASERDACHRSRATLGLVSLSIDTADLASAASPCIITGHQAAVWHAGVMAKYLAGDLIAESLRTEHPRSNNAHIVVDHDTNSPQHLSFPVIGTTAGQPAAPSGGPVAMVLPGRLRLSLSAAPAHMPALYIPPLDPAPLARLLAQDRLHPLAHAGASAIHDALARRSSAPSAAVQLANAVTDLLTSGPMPTCLPGPAIFASNLHTARTFTDLAAEMADDAHRCTQAYNQAVAAFPRARLTRLRTSAGRIELPLWRLDSFTRQRLPVFADEIRTIATETLAPKALTLTLFVRRFLCDLFIHGTGGGAYDLVMERWLELWRPAWRLAPTGVVSANVYLPFALDRPLPTPAEIANARWKAHKALHDPSIVGDWQAYERKRDLLRQNQHASGSDRAQRRATYAAMHAQLLAFREEHAAALAHLDAQATELQSFSDAAEIVFDRTWPFALHSPQTIAKLRSTAAASLLAQPTT